VTAPVPTTLPGILWEICYFAAVFVGGMSLLAVWGYAVMTVYDWIAKEDR